MTGRSDYSHYVQGSTVRKINREPWKEEEQKQILRPIRTTEKRHSRHEHMQGVDAFSLLFMMFCIGITFYVCVSYIQVQLNVRSLGKAIAAKESMINDLKEKNDAAYNRIDTNVDLSYVYDVAVNELGMVRADQSQIHTYTNRKSDFVRKYGEIPETKKDKLEQAITNAKK